jgi:beta-glucosidase
VFVHQWMIQGQGAPNLSLPENQDDLVEAVVLETGGPVSIPGPRGQRPFSRLGIPALAGGATANVLFGDVNPSGKLPATVARQDADLPYPYVPALMETTGNNGMDAHADRTKSEPQSATVDYNVQGLKVGYKWFQTERKQTLFAFGHGLSYTTSPIPACCAGRCHNR